MKVTCIIPAYNEEGSIGALISLLRRVDEINEIIIVDDGSSDNTYECARKEEGIILMRHKKNKGKGAAIKTGIRKATCDILLFLDGDLISLTPRKIRRIIEPISEKGYDVSIGYFRPVCFQIYAEAVYLPLMRLLFPEALEIISKGHLSGQRAFRREIINKMKLRDGFELEAGMNIDLAFMAPRPKVAFAGIGLLKVKPKKYSQKYMEGMSAIANLILSSANKRGRIDCLRASSYPQVIHLFDDTLRAHGLLKAKPTQTDKQYRGDNQ